MALYEVSVNEIILICGELAIEKGMLERENQNLKNELVFLKAKLAEQPELTTETVDESSDGDERMEEE